MSSQRSRRAVAAVLGQPAVRRVALTHAIDDMADALITLSLIGSLFFSVSLDASRGRILLYLLLTAAPLALVAPIVGPALDRVSVGYRSLIAASQLRAPTTGPRDEADQKGIKSRPGNKHLA